MRHLDAHIAASLAGLTFPLDHAASASAAGSIGFTFGAFAPTGASTRNEPAALRVRPFDASIVSATLAPLPRLKLLSLHTARGPTATPPPALAPPITPHGPTARGTGTRRHAAWGSLVDEVLDEVSTTRRRHARRSLCSRRSSQARRCPLQVRCACSPRTRRCMRLRCYYAQSWG